MDNQPTDPPTAHNVTAKQAGNLMTVGFAPKPSVPTNGVTATSSTSQVRSAPRRSRRRGLGAIGLLLIAVAVALAVSRYDPRNLFNSDAGPVATAQRDTALVSVAQLSESYESEGFLIYENTKAVIYPTNVVPGVVTEIVSEASTVSRGAVLWRVGNEPTVAFVGEMPSYRTLEEGDEGPDVEQLEANLVGLGYDAGQTVTIDESFTANTALMVERWQEEIGADPTGQVSSGSVVYMASPASRVGAVHVAVGDSLAGGAGVLDLTGTQRVLTFVVEAAERDTLEVGDEVNAHLPDRTGITAEVTSLAMSSGGTLAVTAAPNHTSGYGIDTVPADVDWTVAGSPDVLTVPASALVRTDAGHYFVETVDAAGRESLTPVEVGQSSGATVEIIGDIAAGDTVIAP